MRFAITCSDRYLGVFDALVEAGWQPLLMFGVPCDGRMFRNAASIERAQALGIGIQLSRIGAADLERLADEGCEALVVASYQWRILGWEDRLRYAVNFHPSLLPAYRGPYPLLNGLRDGATRWGVSCHKLAPEFDAGDILAQRAFAVDADETHETLDLKSQLALRRLAREVAADFPRLWDGAWAQGEGSAAPLLGDAERRIDFGQGVAQILHRIRVFGRFECLAQVNGVTLHVARAAGWVEAHADAPGTVVHAYALTTVVACRDGYIALLEWHLFAPLLVTGTPPR
ncbi:MAG: formyl transferase [Burkholderiales bacterium]|nr:formyl transferase [Burkholderiales bacterium]